MAPATGGQLSEDGQWQWDGSQWQPTAGGPASGGGAQQSSFDAPSGHGPAASGTTTQAAAPTITVSAPNLVAGALPDGTTGLNVTFTVTNTGTASIDADTLVPTVFARSTHAAESNAKVAAPAVGALAAGAAHEGKAEIQLDPGTWAVTIEVKDTAGVVAGTSPESSVHIPGHEAAQRSFDDTQPFALSVTIDKVEHEGASVFRVHYRLENTSDRELPAGMQVRGDIDGASTQWYQLQSALAARQSHENHLTLEATFPSRVTATITVDPTGVSTATDSVTVDIADDGTPTMSR